MDALYTVRKNIINLYEDTAEKDNYTTSSVLITMWHVKLFLFFICAPNVLS